MKIRHIVLSALFAAMAASGIAAQDAAAPPRTEREAAAAWTLDGLQKVERADIDAAYARPGADLSQYKRVLLRPATVAFRRGWERDAASGRNRRVRDEDAQRIRDRLVAGLREELTAELTAGGYTVVDQPGADVLAVDIKVVDLYVVAPPQRQGPDEVFAVSAGEMTLIVELADSITGETLGRAFDHSEARETHYPHRIARSENEQEARAMARDWAKALRRELDAARGLAAPTAP